MGVGLFIAHTIIKQHGGRLWFESDQRAGTTFYIALPLA
jgi:two-component system sensor histidine kinase VicK